MVTRREQQGTDDSALEARRGKKPKPKAASTQAVKPKRQRKTTQKDHEVKNGEDNHEDEDDKIDDEEKVQEETGENNGKGAKAKAKAAAKAKAKAAAKAKAKAAAKAKAKAAAKAKAKAASAKAKAKAASRKEKKIEEAKTDSPDSKKTKTEQKKIEEVQEESDLPKTWASRWTPTEPVARAKFLAIRSVFLSCIAPRVKAPSAFQNSFYKLVNSSFKSLSPSATESDYVACAKKNVEKFLAEDHVRT